ncbi:MAG: hypothetical protein IPP71_02085 [Bacteroidetes bacterium]|nr:hypothetical protein [Bacteroidota bacterium]
MKNALKYLILAAYLMALSYVFVERFTTNVYILYPVGVAISLVAFLLIKKQIHSYSFHKFFLIYSFLFFILIPFLGKKESTSFEKRELAAFPNLRLSNVWKFFYEYQDYFNDRFAFRNEAVQAISKFRFHLFRVSPMPQIVKVGQGDWLYTSREEYIFDTSTPFTKAQLDSVILNLQIVTKYFDIRNIKYYYAMLPVKERIYPEYMPADLRKRMTFSKRDQLYAELKNHPEIRSIDCKDVLIEGKKIRPTFYTTDTHWNEYGAFLGYRKIIERVRQDFPQIVPFEESDFVLDSSITDAGDLQLLMGFRDVMRFTHYHLKRKSGPDPVIVDSTYLCVGNSRYSIREMPHKPTGLKLFLVRDSFTEYLRIFITPNFDRTIFAWMPVVPVANVVNESPNIVIHEILEHFVVYTKQLPPEIAGDTLFLNTYFPGFIRK